MHFVVHHMRKHQAREESTKHPLEYAGRQHSHGGLSADAQALLRLICLVGSRCASCRNAEVLATCLSAFERVITRSQAIVFVFGSWIKATSNDPILILRSKSNQANETKARPKKKIAFVYFISSLVGLNFDVRLCSHQQIDEVCDGFPNSGIVGRGGFGPVFRGRFCGREVAVKRLDGYGLQGTNNFLQEVKVKAAKIRSRAYRASWSAASAIGSSSQTTGNRK